MNICISGYYGYDNAGDDAVLAAMLGHLSERLPASTFTVTSGNPARTVALFDGSAHRVQAVPRDNFRALLHAVKSCDLFLSGGGSLLQDVTSVRNVIYYSTLIRWARLARKPAIIYAQGVGPLHRKISQKLTRAAMQGAALVCVRDEDSAALLRRIGVRRPIEVTADPVWALEAQANPVQAAGPTWCVCLRPWPGRSDDENVFAETFQDLAEAARAHQAKLKFLPMQPAQDRKVAELFCARYRDVDAEIVDTANRHPRAIMGEAGACDLMIAMRLHALIFAAAQKVPCVAISYDPKVQTLARRLKMPMLEGSSLSHAVAAAQAPNDALLHELKTRALRNAELVAEFVASSGLSERVEKA